MPNDFKVFDELLTIEKQGLALRRGAAGAAVGGAVREVGGVGDGRLTEELEFVAVGRAAEEIKVHVCRPFRDERPEVLQQEQPLSVPSWELIMKGAIHLKRASWKRKLLCVPQW